MAWTSKTKDISITSTKDHPAQTSGLVARVPANASVTFTPAEFFGAAARCCHTHVINPALVTAESTLIKALVEQHVDDTNNDFAIESTADNFKDYAKSYFAGTVAAGIAYLAMIQDGYTWSDHFENVGGGKPGATKSPDFVFARARHGDVALVESKGTRSTSGGFNATVRDGYTDQVEPHLGHTVGTSMATHGYCIGSDLASTTKGELKVHHTGAVAAGAGPGPGAGPGSTAAVQRHNYATALRLAHSERLSRQVRGPAIEDQDFDFFYFDWLDQRWLTGQIPEGELTPELLPGWPPRVDWPLTWAIGAWGLPVFALECNRAFHILSTLAGVPAREHVEFDIPPMDIDLMRAARLESGGGAAIFPDGFATFTNRNLIKRLRHIVYNPHNGRITYGSW